MTLGAVAKDVREIAEDIRRLEDRVTIIETSGGSSTGKQSNGSALTDEQTKQINAIAKEQADQSFNRLIRWTAAAAFAGGAAVVAAYLKMHG